MKQKAAKPGINSRQAGCAEPEAVVANRAVDGCSREQGRTRSYIIFRCRFAQDMFCAVSTSGPIPEFLLGAGWAFQGTHGKRGFRQVGLKPTLAQVDARHGGYHIFASPRRRE